MTVQGLSHQIWSRQVASCTCVLQRWRKTRANCQRSRETVKVPPPLLFSWITFFFQVFASREPPYYLLFSGRYNTLRPLLTDSGSPSILGNLMLLPDNRGVIGASLSEPHTYVVYIADVCMWRTAASHFEVFTWLFRPYWGSSPYLWVNTFVILP